MKYPLTQLLFTFLAFFIITEARAQVDSFRINEYNFKFIVPKGWTLYSKDNGICEYSETNVKMEMPLTCKKCFGSLMISISEITESEKRKRSIEDESEDSLKLDDTNFEIKYSDFRTAGGYYDARPDNDTFYYEDSRGSLVTTKKKSKNKKWTEVHRYARWSYLPINDSLEVLIYFQGFIPHDEETNADAATIQLAKYFFESNKNTLDSLLKHTSPYRDEPEFLPLDSMHFLNTFLKYPLLPNWSYDTSLTKAEDKTILLKLKPAMPDSCDDGLITMSYKITPVDPKDRVKREYVDLAKEYLPLNMYNEAMQKAQDTSGFAKQKQHYYFSQESNTETRTDCPQFTRYFETLQIFIYTKPDERIAITIEFMGTSADDQRRADYFHDYYRFIYNFVVSNDFEKIYMLNKQ